METQWHGAQLLVSEEPHCSADRSVQVQEEPGYLQAGTEQIYCVLHRPLVPRVGQVLLAGPFAPSREQVYVCWVRWARFLAASGFQTLRFDYRGTGESGGRFEQMGLDQWLEDVQCCVRWLQGQGGGCPVVLHGLELGALLASKAFEQGAGDALLLWSAPASAREILGRALQLKRIQQYALRREPSHGTGDGYAAELEAGRPVTVGGLTWSPRLWNSSAGYVLPEPHAGRAGLYGDRPCKAVKLEAAAGPLCLSAAAGRANLMGGQLNPDLTPLFRANLHWIRSCLMGNRSECETDPAS